MENIILTKKIDVAIQTVIDLNMEESSLFQEEISACAVVHKCYVMNACDRVRPIILLPLIMGTSFVLVMLTRLIISKPKHRVT